MIAVRPGTDAWKVLGIVVQNPGKLDAQAIGHEMWGVPPSKGRAEYFAYRAGLHRAAEAKRKGEPVETLTSRAAKLLHRLQQAGYILRLQPPMPGEDWELEEEVAPVKLDLMRALVREAPQSMREWVGAAPSGALQRMLQEMAEDGLYIPPSHRWPSQAGIDLIQQRMLQEMAEDGLYIPPSHRWPSQAGIDLYNGQK